jgi:hypothetical protein
MQDQKFPLWAAGALAGGVVLWVAIAARHPPAREGLPPLDPPGRAPRLALLAVALALAALAWRNTSGGVYRLSGVAPWLGAIATWLAAWWVRGPRSSVSLERPEEPELDAGVSRSTRIAALVAIVAIGAVFLFYRLAETPGNPTSDHAEKLSDVLDLVHGQRPIFFIRNTGREPFQFYWTFALIEGLELPLRYLTLKIGTTIIGLAALPALYALGREVGGARLGLVVAAMAAWSKWPVSLARQGLRYTLGVLPTVVVFWALMRYFRRGDRKSALFAGLALGIGLHGYISFRVVPLLAVGVFAFAAFDRRRRGRRTGLLLDGIATAGTAFVTSLPLLHYMVEHADEFWYRAATRAGSVERSIGAHPLAIFARNLWNMLLAFDWRGSTTWVVVVQNEPFLDAVTASFWVAGCVLAVFLVARGSRRYAIVLFALFVLTLPSTLSLAFPDENPSINRAGTAIPAVFLVAALPAVYLMSSARRSAALVGKAGVGLLFLVSIDENARQYFVDFHRQYSLLVDHATQMARVLDDYRKQGVPLRQMYLLYSDYWVDGRNIAFELGDLSWSDTQIFPPGQLPRGIRERPLVFLHTPGAPVVAELEKAYPGKDRVVPQDFADRNFSVYYAP